jgi:hypothetical protein
MRPRPHRTPSWPPRRSGRAPADVPDPTKILGLFWFAAAAWFPFVLPSDLLYLLPSAGDETLAVDIDDVAGAPGGVRTVERYGPGRVAPARLAIPRSPQ